MHNVVEAKKIQLVSLSDSELLHIGGGGKEDRNFGELVGNAVAYAVADFIKIPVVSSQIKANAEVNIVKWYLKN